MPVAVIDILAVSMLGSEGFPVRNSSIIVGPLSCSEGGVFESIVADEVVVVVVFGAQFDVVDKESMMITGS